MLRTALAAHQGKYADHTELEPNAIAA
jgi:hypothetical protein